MRKETEEDLRWVYGEITMLRHQVEVDQGTLLQLRERKLSLLLELPEIEVNIGRISDQIQVATTTIASLLERKSTPNDRGGTSG